MEETIRVILKKHLESLSDKDGMVRIFGIQDSAKEITQHVFEFVEWLRLNTSGKSSSMWSFYFPETDMHLWVDTKDAYSYWLNNVHNAKT